MRLIPTSITQKTVDPNDPTGGMTLDALMLRQKQLQQSKPEVPAQIASPWQGAALMANTFVNSLGQAKAQSQEAAGRDLMARTIAGIDPVKGATPEQQATLMKLDPDTSMKYIADAMQARRAQIQQDHQDALMREGWSHQDAAAAASQAASAALAREGWAHADTSQEAGFKHADTATEQEHKYQESQPQTDVGKLDADLKAGRITQDEYAAKISQMQPAQYRPMTADEYRTWNIPVGADGQPTQPYRFNIKENKPEAVGTGLQPVPSEMAAKVGLAKGFITQDLPQINADIEKGAFGGLKGSWQLATDTGKAAQVASSIKGGSEALVRILTGAGKSESEARDEAQQYLPGPTDSVERIKFKVNTLQKRLQRVVDAVEQGKRGVDLPPPDTTGGGGDVGGDVTKIPEGAITELKTDPSPAAIAEFDAQFGAGMASKALGKAGQ